MTLPARIAIGAFVAILIVAAGFTGGLFFAKHQAKSSLVETLQTQAAPPPNFNTYDISPPSRAVTIQTQDIFLQNSAGYFAMLKPEDAAEVKTGQKVLLFDRHNMMLETLGSVSAISMPVLDEKNVRVFLKLRSDEFVRAQDAVRGRIIVRHIPDSARLPLSALVFNDQKEPYIWEAVENTDGTTTAYYKRINVASATDEYFVIEPNGASGGAYILNPDSDLRDGQTINVRKVMYAGPPQTEDARIEALMKERTSQIAARRARKAAEEDGGNCAAKPSIVRDFIKKIKQMAKPPASMPQQHKGTQDFLDKVDSLSPPEPVSQE